MPIQGPADRVTGVQTTVTDEDDVLRVVYHSTTVVKATPKTIRLDTGGYATQTTRRRMNQASNQFNLGYEVLVRYGEWIVKYGEDEIPYPNDVLLLRRG